MESDVYDSFSETIKIQLNGRLKLLYCLYMYDIQDPLTVIHQQPPPKEEYNDYIRTKITVYYEKQFRTSSSTNSKMLYLNVNVKGLNGRCHPALQNISSTNDVKRLRPHIKMLCSDLYTYEIKLHIKVDPLTADCARGTQMKTELSPSLLKIFPIYLRNVVHMQRPEQGYFTKWR